MFWRKKSSRPLEDFKAEIESHLALESDQVRDSGSSPDPEAAARLMFGNLTSAVEARYEHGRWMLWDHFKRDFLQALRQMKSRPGFSAVAILTLALGIGANAAMFSIIQAVLLRPLPYKDPSRLTMLYSSDSRHELRSASLLNFTDWKSQNHSFEDMTMFRSQTFLLGTDGSPERLRSARVAANFWTLLGAKPILGRVFTQEEEARGEQVVVLSHALWVEKFGASPSALNATLLMDGRSRRVIGVMPAEFQFPQADNSVCEPITAHPYWFRDRQSTRSTSGWFALGRLKSDITLAAAQEEMSAIGSRLKTAYPQIEMPTNIEIVPLDQQFTSRFRLSLWLLFGSVFLILLIACINVASLLLARGSVREREFALRRALGAGRFRLAAQLLTETLVLAACGGLLGLLIASVAVSALVAYGPSDIPRLAESRIDWPVLAFIGTISIFTAVFASLWPAFQSSTNRAASSRQGTTVSMRRVRDLLVAGEFALALMLVTGAGLLVHSFLRLRSVELGFRPDHLLMMRIDLHVGRSADQQAVYFEDAVDHLCALPGVRSAAAITGFLRTDPEDAVEIEGRGAPQHPGPCDDVIAGPYFETAGIPLKKGRLFSSQDRRNSQPVAIVNEKMVRTYWPDEDPIGQRFRFGPTTPWLTVVGVTGDMRRQGIDRQVAPQIFRPHRQASENMFDLIVRTETAEPMAMAPMIQNEIQSLDKTVAKFKVTTVEQRLGDQTAERRFDTVLIGAFAFVALFLSAVGIYGLMHHLVAQRSSEIGVRMALGARPGAVIKLILRQGLTLALAGVGAGLIGTLGLAKVMSSFLYEVAPTDPLSFGGSTLLLLAVAAFACWIPALRAARIDPLRALRQD